LDADAAVVCLEAEERPAADEAVPADALAADDALEQEGPVAVVDLAEGGDRRQRVADQLPEDGDEAGVARQRQEFVKTRTVAHTRFPSAGLPLVKGGPRSSFPNSVWERQPAKLCFALGRIIGSA